MYISDLILLIIVIAFIARAVLKKRRAGKTGANQHAEEISSHAELPHEACHCIKVLSYYYDALPFKDAVPSPTLPLNAAIEEDVNEAMESLSRQGFTPSISYAAVVDRLFVFIEY